jgi:hypothetical protein
MHTVASAYLFELAGHDTREVRFKGVGGHALRTYAIWQSSQSLSTWQ